MRIIAAILVLVLAPSLVPARDTPSFDAALQAHFDAIQSRDLDAFKATVTREPEMTLIFPGGEILTTREAVIELHREWFTDTSWTWEPEIIATTVGSDLAYALLRYTYTDEAAPRQNWLSLLFRLEDDAWRLVRDQNTPARAIPTPPRPGPSEVQQRPDQGREGLPHP